MPVLLSDILATFQNRGPAHSVLVLGNTDVGAFSVHAYQMFQGSTNRRQFIVTCKLCRRDVPSGVKEFPFHSIVVTCSLCGEERQYLPSEVILGRPYHSEAKQA